jgi:hypothetical protein
MIPLEKGFLDRYGLGEECPDDRYSHYVSGRIIPLRGIETIDVMIILAKSPSLSFRAPLRKF